MAKNEFWSSFSPPKILKKFSTENTKKEKKQARLILLALFGLSVLAVGFATAYRELPRLWRNINEPATVISQKYTPALPTVTPTPKLQQEKQAVEEMTKPLRGKYGIYFQDLETRDYFEINGKEIFPAASLIKLPVILTLYREADAGKINLDEVYRLQAVDKRDGAGSLIYKPVGFEITYRKMTELMGKQSDNTAFYIISKILGATKIQETIDALGMRSTSFEQQTTTPEDIGLFFRKLYRERVVSEKGKEEILAFLTDTIWEDRIPAGVPKGIKVSHKIGTLPGVISDAGIVFSPKLFILVIMSDEANEIEAQKALPEITKKIYDLTQ